MVLEKIAPRALPANGLFRAFSVVAALTRRCGGGSAATVHSLVIEFVELLLVRAVCELHGAVELGRVRRLDE